MKTINHSKLNRPVHLARRDVYFKQAAKLISAQQHTPETGVGDYEEILFLLRVARSHASYAVRDKGKNETGEQFYRFINLLAGNVKAVLSLLNLKGMVENSEDSIFSFLGANQASVALQSEEYQRRANDISRSIHNTLKLAKEPYAKLKEEDFSGLDQEEQGRYTKASKHSSQQIKAGLHRYNLAPSSGTLARG